MNYLQHLGFQNGLKNTATKTYKLTPNLRNKMLTTQVKPCVYSFP